MYAKMHKLLGDVTRRHHNAQNSDASVLHAPTGWGVEMYDISGWSFITFEGWELGGGGILRNLLNRPPYLILVF